MPVLSRIECEQMAGVSRKIALLPFTLKDTLLVRIERSALVSYSCERMFALVNDIESYPKYMPGCGGAKILEQGEGWLKASLELSMMGIKQGFTTRNNLSPPHSMRMTLENGPFKSLEGEWQFKALNDSACKVSFWLEFEVKSSILGFAFQERRLITNNDRYRTHLC